MDLTYGWELHHIMNQVAQGKQTVADIDAYFERAARDYNTNDIRIYFTSNHDENSWNGTEWERMGKATDVMTVFSYTIPGMPLVYSGQEAGSTKRLKFFEKDPIQWREHPNGELYRKLFALKHANTALWNAHWGALMVHVPSDDGIFSFVRSNDRDKVFAVFNFTKEAKTAKFKETLFHGSYTDYFSGERVELGEATSLKLEPWGFRVFVK